MRRLAPLLLLPLLAGAPASAVEAATASASWDGTDLHSLGADCVVAGTPEAQYTVTAVAEADESFEPASRVDVACVVYRAGTRVHVATGTGGDGVAVVSQAFVSGEDLTICVQAWAWWAHGDSVATDGCP